MLGHDRPPARLRRPATACAGPSLRALLAQGMGAGPTCWDRIEPNLAPHLDVWEADLPWSVFGDPAWADRPDATQWISRSIEHVQILAGMAPDLVVAHSFAANVTLHLLSKAGQKASAAVLISPFYRPDHQEFDWMAVIPGLEACFASAADRIGQARGAHLRGDVRDAMVRRLLQSLGQKAPLRFYEVCRQTPDLDLESVDIPVLVVSGANDELSGVDDLRAMTARLPQARLEIIDDCGHFPMTDRPEHLATLIGDFAQHAILAASPASPEGAR